MTSTLTNRDGIADPDEILAASFLARYREPTRSGYKLCLRQWFQWCANNGFRPRDAERAHLELYQRELEEVRGLKVATIAGKMNAICGLYKFAVIDGYMERNPAMHVKRPTVPRISTTNGLTRQEMQRLVEASHNFGPQDEAVICIMGYNGLRVGEMCALNVEDIGRQDGYHTISFIREKSRKPATLPLAPRTSWAISKLIYGRTSGPVFMHRNEVRMNRAGADRVVKRCAKVAGIEKRISCHSLRHTFVTLALNAGASVRDVQNAAGHADARMVTYYDRDSENIHRNPTMSVAAFVEGS